MEIKHGYKLSRKSKKNYSFHKTFGAIAIANFPSEYSVRSKFPIPSQNAEGLPYGCTAYTVVGLCQDEDNIEYDVKKQYEVALTRAKLPPNSGMTLDQAFDIPVKIGLWPKNDPNADPAIYRKPGYFFIDGPYDHFDNIRSAMLLTAAEKRAVGAGFTWYADFELVGSNAVLPENPTMRSSGHSPIFDGWTQKRSNGEFIRNGEVFLTSESHQGPNIGDNGTLYFSRALINRLFSEWGSQAVTIKKALPGEVKRIEISLLQQFLEILKQFYNYLKSRPMPKPDVTVSPNTVTTQPLKYLWDNKDNVRHSVRVICDEEGLSYLDKGILTACVQQESQFNPKAIGKPNVNGTRDWGIAQFNDGKNAQGVPFWIGPGATFKDTDEVLNNPEKCIRVMCSEWKKGHQNYWASYSSGAYKKYL